MSPFAAHALRLRAAGIAPPPPPPPPGSSAWAAAMTVPLQWRALAPVATIASFDLAGSAASNPNFGQPDPRPPWASTPLLQILNAWGGGAYSQTTKKVIVAGGGHAGYMGNELYSLDLRENAPTWVRLCLPSGSIQRPATFTGAVPDEGAAPDLMTDGRPKAAHSNGALVQSPAGILYQMPGAVPDRVGTGGFFTTRAHRFDPAAGDWAGSGATWAPTYTQPGASCWDSLRGVIWTAWGQRVYKVDPATLNPITVYGGPLAITDGLPYYGRAIYVPSRDRVAVFGGDSLILLTFNPADPSGTAVYATLTGTPPPAPAGKHYSADWHEASGRLIVGNGSHRVFTLTPSGDFSAPWAWGELTVDTSVFLPAVDTGNGIFGRLNVDQDLNRLIVVPSDITAPVRVLLLE